MYNLYLALALVSVTIHVSRPRPTLQDPHAYALATCSGVFISPDEVLTAGHCMRDSRDKQWIKTVEGVSYPVSIEKVDELRDLALLKVTRPLAHKYIKIGKAVKITQPVFTVNQGNGYTNTWGQGYVDNIIIDDDTSTFQILHSAVFSKGASGSGLFNEDKELVGINTYIEGGFYGAVDITEVRKFLHR